MAGSPPFKIHDASGEYVASAKTAVLAAVIVAFLGGGAVVKYGGRIVWKEGSESERADLYPNDAAELMSARILSIRKNSVHYA